MNVVQPAGWRGDITQIAPLTLTDTRQAIVELQLATDDEVDATVAELGALADEPPTIVSMPRVVQAWGRAPRLPNEAASGVGGTALSRLDPLSGRRPVR